ncbi:DNA-3-methyladenine glycosylase 2 family protein [Paenalkalicoccus suaedae]|uniref:DNA-3-methyladenine glycosylase II n=1 Tax=Paenalkalicoccus suaedae TaxID=2592382 RepID=A0A859FK56_9BACI|nr:DNA-3-methyladenine glycosylase 2 family protein [Paenalkalicoccus suaedae]
MTLKGPYRFEQALKRLSIDPLLTIDVEAERIKMPLIIQDKPVVAVVTQIGTVMEPKLDVTMLDEAPSELVKAEITRIFHLETPLTEIHAFFSNTELAPIFNELKGTPFVCEPSLFGCIAKTIIHQQLNMKFAYTLSERFVKTFGFNQHGAWFYPSPEKVATLTVEQLRELQFSGRKAEYVIDTAKLIASGALDLHELGKKMDDEMLKELIAIRGIGRWTAENILMFGYGRMDLFPVQDIGIQNTVKILKGLATKPTVAELDELAINWQPYRTYAALYLWESIETNG